MIDAATKPLPGSRAAPPAPTVIAEAVRLPPGGADGVAAVPIAQRAIDAAFR